MTDENMLTDYLTGETIPNIGSEMNRQKVAQYLVEEKGFNKIDIRRDTPIELDIAGEPYTSCVDLLIFLKGKELMAIKCAAGSIDSYVREILSAARLISKFQIPFSAVSDGKSAIILNTLTGEKIGEGLDSFLSKNNLIEKIHHLEMVRLSDKRRQKEKLIFRTYDTMNINVSHRT